MNTDAPWPTLIEAEARVLGIQRKLHQWATDDPHRRFDDLFNLVADPAFLVVAWDRVRGTGSRGTGQPGSIGGAPLAPTSTLAADGSPVREHPRADSASRSNAISRQGGPACGISTNVVYYWIERHHLDARRGPGGRLFISLGEVEASSRAGADDPQARHYQAPSPGRCPTARDRTVQAALKLVLEPIFEADFEPCSYGFRPKRRARDAIAEIVYLASPPRNYEWVLEGDITACFDAPSHCLFCCWGLVEETWIGRCLP